MVAFDRLGHGPSLVLLHGTNSSRHVWDPILPSLTSCRDVIAVDLPAHGQSAATSFTPPEFAREVAVLLDELDLHAPGVVGHSVGGWTALELAKLGRASAVLALAPAGLWRKHSPWMTDLGLQLNWRLGQMLGPGIVERSLRTRIGRRSGLRWISAHPGDVPYHLAAQTARAAIDSHHFPIHFAKTRVLRFSDGQSIPGNVPITIVWGDADRVAPARRSRFTDQLPAHAEIETWARCGHMTMWDRQQETIRAAIALTAANR